MNSTQFSTPIDLRHAQVTDDFWQREMTLVRQRVIPYQWEALNDRVPGAEPSWSMHNFRAAARLQERRRAQGEAFVPPVFAYPGFQVLPKPGETPDPDKFYGFLFQDSDFYKWIEAVAYSLTQHPDPELEATCDGAIDVICAAQNPDGYLDTYYILNGMDKAFSNLKDNHELYCLGHLIEAAIAYREATGKDKLLRTACLYADHVDGRFGPEEGRLKGYPGHEITELALLKLAEATGEDRYRRLAMFFIDQRGTRPHYFDVEGRLRDGDKWREGDYAYHQAHKPVREQEEITGHAVRAMYLCSGMADAARLTGDETLWAACQRLWRSTVRDKLYVTGGVGGTHVGEAFSRPFDLPNDTAYSETCAAIGLAFFARRMLQIAPRAEYADVMEQALYNTVLAGMALDGESFFYVNPLSVEPAACRSDRRLDHVKPVRQKWFGCSCCPPNLARIVSSIAAYAWTESADTLYTHLYIGGRVAFRNLTMEIATGMPWSGQGQAIIHADAPVSCTLAFRLPGWSKNARVVSDGKEAVVRDGYCYLTGTWREGDVVRFDFPMAVRVLSADPRVRENIGRVAIMRGPVAYCAEEADNGPDLHLLRVEPQRAAQQAQVEGVVIAGHPVKALRIPALRMADHPGDTLYADWQPPQETPCTLTLIPYYAWCNRGEGEMQVWLRT